MKPYLIMVCSLLYVATTNGQHQADTSLPKGWWHIPKTPVRVKVGGYIKADFIHDFNPIGSPDFFDVSKIPTDGSKGQTTHFNVKETRLVADAITPTKKGKIRAYLETDFYGTNGAPRIRHAFIEINDRWLAGQYWSNFMDENIIPNTLDFEKPLAYAFARHAMLRWKHSFQKNQYIAIALEEPSTNATAPAQAGKFYAPLPDITARYRITGKWGHWQLSAFAAWLQYRYASNETDMLNLFGFNMSGQLNVGQRDYLIYQAVGGPGSGRMRGGLSAAPNAQGQLETLNDFGITGGFCHYWTPSLSSLVVYNYGKVNNTEGQSGSSFASGSYLAANLLWQFAPGTMAGVEYLHGQRNDKSDANGQANRIQFSLKHSINL